VKRIYKYLLWTTVSVVILAIGYYMFATAALSGAFDKHYSVDEAIHNYNDREKEILNLADYFRRNKPANHEVFFSAQKKRFNLSIGLPSWAVMEKFPNRHGSNLKLETAEAETLLSELGWTDNIVIELTEKLMKANCLSISSNENTIDVHYRTGTWSSYSYIVFDKPISDSLKKVYDEAKITMLRDNVKLATSHAL
jgi:hypothetical protein